MIRAVKLLMGAASVFAGASFAQASGTANQSSATMTITVTIPPFLAALAAQRDGAVGLWTVTDDRNALMINTPDEIVAGEEVDAAIYHGAGMLFSVAAEAQAPFAIRPSEMTSDNGLRRRGYRIAPTVGALSPSSASILISAV